MMFPSLIVYALLAVSVDPCYAKKHHDKHASTELLQLRTAAKLPGGKEHDGGYPSRDFGSTDKEKGDFQRQVGVVM